ncbi:hypothetical protein Bbelb_019690 [Branchiostoma belcheri]|nr:hypothetical protein Bbelb_019690 [Branchiostoma belcheri]
MVNDENLILGTSGVGPGRPMQVSGLVSGSRETRPPRKQDGLIVIEKFGVGIVRKDSIKAKLCYAPCRLCHHGAGTVSDLTTIDPPAERGPDRQKVLWGSVGALSTLRSTRSQGRRTPFNMGAWTYSKVLLLLYMTTMWQSTPVNGLTTQEAAQLTKTAFTCERGTLQLSCSDRKTLLIVEANYGRTTASHSCACSTCRTNCRAATSLAVVRAACQGKRQCSVTASSSVFGGDPCYGVQKYLEVSYRCITESNVALRKTASCSSAPSHWGPEKAVDGSRGTRVTWYNQCTHTNHVYQPWWKVDLGGTYPVNRVSVLNRGDCCALPRIGSPSGLRAIRRACAHFGIECDLSHETSVSQITKSPGHVTRVAGPRARPRLVEPSSDTGTNLARSTHEFKNFAQVGRVDSRPHRGDLRASYTRAGNELCDLKNRRRLVADVKNTFRVSASFGRLQKIAGDPENSSDARRNIGRDRLRNFMVRVGPNEDFTRNDQCGETYTATPRNGATVVVYCDQPMTGRYVSIQLIGRADNLQLCEVDVFAETVLQYTSLGCWRDSGSRAMAYLEGTNSLLDGDYQSRHHAIQKCYLAALSRHFTVFGVQHGGQCFGSADGINTYNRYGPTTTCAEDGEGGAWGNEVYKITGYTSLGCWRDTNTRAIPTLEGTDSLLDGDPQSRQHAIQKCYQVALSRDFTVFAVQYGGECFGSANGINTYNRYGPTTTCAEDGKGGAWGNEVYKITGKWAGVDGK